MKKLNIAKFNKRVLFQSATKIEDNMGGFSQIWQDSFTRWGYVRSSKTEQQNIVNVDRFAVNKTLILRAEVSINRNLRCVIDGRIYQITKLDQHKDLTQWLECELELVEGV
jgi:SPP1 family predicted phage head-tail adaptor